MKLLLLVVMLVPCAADLETVKDPTTDVTSVRNLRGQMLTFPKPNGTNIVLVTPRIEVLRAATVCLRQFTDTAKDFSIFSISTRNANDELKLSKMGNKGFRLSSGKAFVDFPLNNYKLNNWDSICTSWDSKPGVGQMWLNGNPSTRKFLSSGSSEGPYSMTFGEKQATSGATFIGSFADIKMWNYALSACEIQSFMKRGFLPPGPVVDWEKLVFRTEGSVLVEDDQQSCKP